MTDADNAATFSRAWDAAAKACGLAEHQSSITFSKGERVPLVGQGQPGVCLIRAGHLALLAEGEEAERIIRLVGPHELVGYGSWMTDEAPRYFLQALEKGALSFYPHGPLQRAQTQSSRIQELVIETLQRTVLLKDERIMALEEGSARQRVKALLYSLAKKFGTRDGDGLVIAVDVSRVMLAKLASTAPENFSRILTDLTEEGVILRRRRRIVVRDLRKVMGRG